MGQRDDDMATVVEVLCEQGWRDVRVFQVPASLGVRVRDGDDSLVVGVLLRRDDEGCALKCVDAGLSVRGSGPAEAARALAAELAARFGAPGAPEAPSAGEEPWEQVWDMLPDAARELLGCVACAPSCFAWRPALRWDLAIIARAGGVSEARTRDLAAVWGEWYLATRVEGDLWVFAPGALAYAAARAAGDGVDADAIARRLLD